MSVLVKKGWNSLEKLALGMWARNHDAFLEDPPRLTEEEPGVSRCVRVDTMVSVLLPAYLVRYSS